MNSARGTKTVRLQRKKSGLDFSVKGGKEHGIPIVVSWIKDGGITAKELRLGDEILAVNGQSLQELPHALAVQKLRGAGPMVVLRVKPNQALEDIFTSGRGQPSSRSIAASISPSGSELEEVDLPEAPLHSGPLPQGWAQKTDHKTGRPYFENHYTQTTTWADPRSLTPIPLKDFEWNTLPPGWDRFLDDQGDIYYVNHDTQTTHWDSPRGMRQQKHLKELQNFVQTEKEKMKAAEEELKQKRELLLEKNQQLNILHSQSDVVSLETDEESGCGLEGTSPADLIDDIMLLDEEVEVMDAHTSIVRRRLKNLAGMIMNAQYEDIGERDEYHASAELALELLSRFSQLKNMEFKLHDLMKSLEELRKRHNYMGAPLQYMLQLPPLKSKEEIEEKKTWLHALQDKLTGKSNCEMSVEVLLLQENCRYAEQLEQRVATLYKRALTSHGGWEQLLDELAGYDFTPLQDHWMQAEFREKLENYCH